MKADQEFAPHRPHQTPYRKADHLRRNRPSGILAKTGHTVPAEIGHPELDNPPRHAESGGNLDARPTIDDDALDDLASLSNADCSVA
jgi:phosphoglycerol transferase MdoB-like AlkP superfamily enzyme